MILIATYAMHYGPKGPMDAEHPLVERGEEFRVQPTFAASAEEQARHLISAGVAVAPADWAKHAAKTDAKYQATRDMLRRLTGGRT